MKLGKLLKRIFNPRPIEGYVSDVDNFLEKFDAENPEDKYAAQEREKHERVAYLRDTEVQENVNEKIWKAF